MSEEARNVIIELVKKKYGSLIKHIAYKITQDYQLAEDTEQEVLWKLARREKDIAEMPPDEMKSYIYVAARNTAINMAKKNDKVKAESLEELVDSELQMESIDIKAFEDEYGFGPEIQELLGLLDSVDRSIIGLKYGLGYKTKEISQIIGLSEEAVRKRDYRARGRLQKILLERRGL